MYPKDFQTHNIDYFSAKEIENTGADLFVVDLEIVLKLEMFRRDFSRTMLLLHNGLTSGNHSAPEHPKGQAVDWCVRECDGPVDVNLIVNLARKHGFAGIGIYHNGAAYSFHFHVGRRYAQWIGWKKHRETEWKYLSLIDDPVKYSTRKD